MDDEATGTGADLEEAEEELRWEGLGEDNNKGAPQGREQQR